VKLYNRKECYQVQIHHGHAYKPPWKKNIQKEHVMILKECQNITLTWSRFLDLPNYMGHPRLVANKSSQPAWFGGIILWKGFHCGGKLDKVFRD
jgi:hypothetical protein